MTTDTGAAFALERIRESAAAIATLERSACVEAVTRAAEVVVGSLRAGGKLLVFGNGGSAADATHIAAELVGRFLVERRGLPALSLSDNSAAVTAVANDYGYERVFTRQIEALGAPGDVALGISTSGRSTNVVGALVAARQAGLTTIGFTGANGVPLREAVDVCVEVPSTATPRIQEAHTVLAHVLCELIERDLA